MLGVPVLQVYGLTETTAICTMDHPAHVQAGFVGSAIDGVEMKLGNQEEILVRGPNIFLGYWNRPQATAEAMLDGWFHTGDQGEVNERGNWRITGRVKNILIPASGHKVPPEPIEEMLLRALPGAQQIVLLGNGRSFLAAVVTGAVAREEVAQALERINPQLPHYKRVHAFHIAAEPFSFENGLLTAMGKPKRDAIAARYQQEVDALYARQPA
jgi:long-chain acyl-CoA synthetase